MKKLLLIALLASGHAWAQNATSALQISQLTQLTAQLQTMNTALTTANNTLEKATQVVQILGNPAQALNAIGGIAGLNGVVNTIQTSQVFQLASTLNRTVTGVQTLVNTGQGLYRSIPTSLPDGTSIVHDLQDYKPFEAEEGLQTNFQNVLQEAINTRNQIVSDIQSTTAITPSGQADQLAQQNKLQALTASLAAVNTKVQESMSQLQAQAIANQNNQAKQDQAAKDAANADHAQAAKFFQNSTY